MIIRQGGREKQTSEAPTEPRTFLASTGFLLARLGMESRRRFTRMMAQHKLSTHHFGLLAALGEHGVIAQQRLSGIVGVDPRNAVPIIDELEKRKLIERRADSRDRRRYDIVLTSTGRTMMRRLQSAGEKLEREMFQPLSDSERVSLHGLLLKLFAAIGEET